MANIIICSSSNIIWTKRKQADPFIEGMINSLSRAGNNILNIITNDLNVRGVSFVHESKLLSKLKLFKPDLIITFNNVLPYKEILDDLDCPVACFAADTCAFFSNQDLIKKHADRYDFFNFSNDTIIPFYKWFPFINKNRVHLFGHVTDLRAESIIQDINVSFIGSIATWNKDFTNYFKSLYQYNLTHSDEKTLDPNKIKDEFFIELDRFKNYPHSEFSCPLPNFNPFIVKSPSQSAILLLTAKERTEILSNITDLGLTIFGYPEVYSDLLVYNYELFRCFDFTPNATMDHTSRNYNRSKISLNLPHAHTKEGLSWRVCDILASNAVLLSCKQPDLVEMTKGYVDLPMYESTSEAREIIIKLLKEENWRADLTAGSQQMINDKYRFETKLKIVEDALSGITLFPNNKTQGNIENLDTKPYIRKIRNDLFQKYKNFKKPSAPKVYQGKRSFLSLTKNKFFKYLLEKA